MNRAVAAGQRGRDEGNRTPNPRLANTSLRVERSRPLDALRARAGGDSVLVLSASAGWCSLVFVLMCPNCAPGVARVSSCRWPLRGPLSVG